MGGTTAALATQEEPRILAGVNLYGSHDPGMNADVRPIPVHKPFLFSATEEYVRLKAKLVSMSAVNPTLITEW